MCNDLGKAITQNTDQGCDEQDVGHAHKDEHERWAEFWIDLVGQQDPGMRKPTSLMIS